MRFFAGGRTLVRAKNRITITKPVGAEVAGGLFFRRAAQGGIAVARLAAIAANSSLRVILPTLLLIHTAQANPSPSTQLLQLEADSVTYSEECKAVIAKGNARAVYNGHILTADKILYLQNTKDLQASGSVIVTDIKGDIYRFQTLNYNLETNAGNALNIKSKTHNQMRISSTGAMMKKKKQYKLFKVVASPCSICAQNYYPDGPLWQIRAEEADIDEEKEQVRFSKIYIDYFGRPIFYWPQMTIPTPNAKRKSGFLLPKVEMSRTFGLRLTMPYYLNIAPNMDATFFPAVGTTIGSSYAVEFRHKVKAGDYRVFTHMSKESNKDAASVYLDTSGKFKSTVDGQDINYGFKIKRLFDATKTYLKKFDIIEEDVLNAQIYADRQIISKKKSSMVSVEAWALQDLRPEAIPTKSPYIFPLLRYHTRHKLDFLNSEVRHSSHVYNIIRESQESQNSLLSNIAIATPMKNRNGHLFQLTNGIYLRAHHFDYSTSTNKSMKKMNIIPYSQFSWRFPLLGQAKGHRFIIEPIALITAVPNAFSAQEENTLEMRKGNFMSPNRFLDWNSLNTRSRFDYGFNMLLDTGRNSSIDLFFGSTRHVSNNKATGVNQDGYISSASIKLNNNTFLINRLRLSADKLHIMQHEVDSVFIFPKTHFSLNYTYRRPDKKRDFPQEVGADLDYNFYRNWWLNLNGRVKMNKTQSFGFEGAKKKVLRDGIGFTYKDDCIKISFAIKRDHTQTKDLKPSVTYLINIGLPTFNPS